jgi:acyl-CoA reductase-like NAD-dependent aldehyde dehydrogenase
MWNASEIEKTLTTARIAFTQWKGRSIPERIKYVSALRKAIVKNLDTLVACIRDDTGKVDLEVFNSDILPTLELIKYYEKQAPKILAPQKNKTSLLFFNHDAYLEYKPLGVVLIIAPWNCPLQLALAPLVSALLAGNAVILKPSEITPRTGDVIGDLCREAGLPDALVQIVVGGKDVGEALIQAGPDKIFFTGGVEAGKNIMAAAAKNMIPVVLELGGKDPMIVFEDADIERAAEAAVYGAFAHAGQLCVAVEKLYVQESVFDRFVSRIVKRISTLRVGTTSDNDLGPMNSPAQIEHIEDQIQDARIKGARFLTDPMKQGSLFFPLALTNVNHGMKLMTEETFGPLLPIMPFKTEEEAVALANDSSYGLNASVWSRDLKKAKRVVSRLETGNAYINDVIKNIGNPHLPFGGVKRSGFGKYHGPEGLRAFSIETAVMINKNRQKREINWFPYTAELADTVKGLINLLYSDLSFREKLRIFLRMRNFIKTLR